MCIDNEVESAIKELEFLTKVRKDMCKHDSLDRVLYEEMVKYYPDYVKYMDSDIQFRSNIWDSELSIKSKLVEFICDYYSKGNYDKFSKIIKEKCYQWGLYNNILNYYKVNYGSTNDIKNKMNELVIKDKMYEIEEQSAIKFKTTKYIISIDNQYYEVGCQENNYILIKKLEDNIFDNLKSKQVDRIILSNASGMYTSNLYIQYRISDTVATLCPLDRDIYIKEEGEFSNPKYKNYEKIPQTKKEDKEKNDDDLKFHLNRYEDIEEGIGLISNKIEFLDRIIEEYDKNNSFSAKTITEMAEKYPEYLKYLNDEPTFIENMISDVEKRLDKII